MKRLGIVKPSNFDEFIGQKVAKQRVLTHLDAALKTNTMPPHFLFTGPEGTGKTSMAYCIAAYLKCNLREYNASGLDKEKIGVIIRSIRRNEVIFLDEIHELSRGCQDMLNSVLEDFVFNTLLKVGTREQEIHLKIEPFCLIGATTEEHKLLPPFRQRFVTIHMEDYSENDIAAIIASVCKRYEIKIEDAALIEIASRSKYNPRTAVKNLRYVVDYHLQRGINPSITRDSARAALDYYGISVSGLEPRDFQYLRVLARSRRPLGITNIASMLRERERTIEYEIEPFLIRSGLVVRTPRGRALTKLGRRILHSQQRSK